MLAFGRALETQVRLVTDDLFATFEGIPDDVFNTWKPVAANDDAHAMNTFAAITTHALGAAHFMTLVAVGGEPDTRDREAEFEATGTVAGLRARYDAWLDALHTMLVGLTEDDLNRETHAERMNARGWKVAESLLHVLDHTALHVGHLQVQRQLWETERG